MAQSNVSSLLSFTPLKHRKHTSLFIRLDRPIFPLLLSTHRYSSLTSPPTFFFFSKALDQLIFSSSLCLPFFFPSLILMLLGCGKYLFTLIDDGADGSFMSVRTVFFFRAADVSEYQPPLLVVLVVVESVEVGVDCRLGQQKPTRPDSISHKRRGK